MSPFGDAPPGIHYDAVAANPKVEGAGGAAPSNTPTRNRIDRGGVVEGQRLRRSPSSGVTAACTP